MKKSIQNRIRKGLFPEMPQSFADRLTGTLKIGGALNADQRSADEAPIAQVIPERSKRRFPFGKIFNGVAAAVLAVLCIVIAVFGIILPNVQKTHGATHPDGYRADFPVGKWTRTRSKYASQGTDYSWIDVDMESWQSWLEITADGHAHLTEYDSESGEALHADFSVAIGSDGIQTDWESCTGMWYDTAADTICMEIVGRRRDYYSRTPDAVIPAGERREITALRSQYPEYFGLDTSKGLKVYVWQMAESDYSCALLSGTDERSEIEIGLQCKGTTIEQMRLILSTYGLEEKDIEIVPFENPISSYAYEIDKMYTAQVTWLLLGTPIEDGGDLFHTAPIDTAVYDVDGDGQLETCVLSNGPTSGLFTVVFHVYRNGTLVYLNTFNMAYGELYLSRASDGLVLERVSPGHDNVPLDAATYRITIENGVIVLTDGSTGEAVIPEVQTTDGEIAATAKRNAAGIWKSGEGDTLWITDDGTARSEALSGLTGNLTYTVEDGTLHFSLTGTDFTFTARYDESKDTLSVTANGNTKLYSRVRSIAGKWTLTGIEYNGSVGSPELFGMQMWLEINANGTAVMTMSMGDDMDVARFLYEISGAEIVLNEVKDTDPMTIRLTYDAETDTLHMDYSQYGYEGNSSLIFSRTPDAVIPKLPSEELTELKRRYPEYFGLDTSEGLKVYVWQMSNDGYFCALLKGADNKTEAEIGGMKGTTIEQMRLILSTYGLEEKEIEVVPFHNPISSYWY